MIIKTYAPSIFYSNLSISIKSGFEDNSGEHVHSDAIISYTAPRFLYNLKYRDLIFISF